MTYVEQGIENKNRRGCGSLGLPILGVIISVLYLSNLTMGIVEIPDNLPFIGNLDEVFFSGILFASLSRLGINLPMGPRRTDAKRPIVPRN